MKTSCFLLCLLVALCALCVAPAAQAADLAIEDGGAAYVVPTGPQPGFPAGLLVLRSDPVENFVSHALPGLGDKLRAALVAKDIQEIVAHPEEVKPYLGLVGRATVGGRDAVYIGMSWLPTAPSGFAYLFGANLTAALGITPMALLPFSMPDATGHVDAGLNQAGLGVTCEVTWR
jgi:hypothetical protein